MATSRLSLDGYGAEPAGDFSGKTQSQAVVVVATLLPQTNLPTYRKYSWKSLVAKAWGARYNDAEIAYEFSKEESERRFYTRDDIGPYKKS
jgi:hypothetical protein